MCDRNIGNITLLYISLEEISLEIYYEIDVGLYSYFLKYLRFS